MEALQNRLAGGVGSEADHAAPVQVGDNRDACEAIQTPLQGRAERVVHHPKRRPVPEPGAARDGRYGGAQPAVQPSYCRNRLRGGRRPNSANHSPSFSDACAFVRTQAAA